jgi:hypothetical protein
LPGTSRTGPCAAEAGCNVFAAHVELPADHVELPADHVEDE